MKIAKGTVIVVSNEDGTSRISSIQQVLKDGFIDAQNNFLKFSARATTTKSESGWRKATYAEQNLFRLPKRKDDVVKSCQVLIESLNDISEHPVSTRTLRKVMTKIEDALEIILHDQKRIKETL